MPKFRIYFLNLLVFQEKLNYDRRQQIRKLQSHAIPLLVLPNFESKILNVKKNFSLSIIVTVYNQPAWQLERCFNSIFNQSNSEFELIVINGGSNNKETLDYLAALKNRPRLKMRSIDNLGIVNTRNFGSEIANSKYLIFLDPDDWLHLDYILNVRNLVLKNSTVELIYTDFEVVDSGGVHLRYERAGPLDTISLMAHNTIPICTVIDKTFFNAIGRFRVDMENGLEDWDLWLRSAIAEVRSAHITKNLFIYSTNNLVSRTNNLKKIEESQKEKMLEFACTLLSERIMNE